MKFEAARCLSLMGFSKMDTIKQHQFVGTSAQVLVASPGDEVSPSPVALVLALAL